MSASGGEVLHEDEAEKELQQLRVSEEIERMRKRMLGCATREDEDMRVVSDSDCEKMCREHIDQEVAAVDVESGTAPKVPFPQLLEVALLVTSMWSTSDKDPVSI